MKKEKTDLRIIKTKRAIHDAFLSLIQNKAYDKVTVQDIADHASINRNTFYLHYTDKFDLMEQLWFEYFNKLKVCFDLLDVCPPILDEEIFRTILYNVFATIKVNLNFFYPMAKNNTHTQFTAELKSRFYNMIAVESDGKAFNQKNHIRFEYMISGIVGVITFWILDHETFNIEDLVKQLTDLHFKHTISIN